MIRVRSWTSFAGWLFCAVGAAASPCAAQGRAWFMGLGDLPGGATASWALDMTPDAGVVVGTATGPDGPLGFVWRTGSARGEMTPIGDLAGGVIYSEAVCVSADGSLVGGFSAGAMAFSQATRWTPATGLVALPDLPGGGYVSLVQACTPDGRTLVGAGSGVGGFRACLWAGAGSVDLGLFADYLETQGADISADGRVVVGSARAGDRLEAFRWTVAGGMLGLGDLPGGLHASEAQAVSADGRTVVGYGVGERGYEACRWRDSAVAEGLGDLSGGDFESYARDVSADGSVVVGIASTEGGYEAFCWTEAGGMRRLRDVLIASGVNMTGWYPVRAQAVSADGRYIAGSAVNPDGRTEAFLAHMGGGAGPDWNDDGVVNIVDLFNFLASWFAGRADFDGSGGTDMADLFAFISAWMAG